MLVVVMDTSLAPPSTFPKIAFLEVGDIGASDIEPQAGASDDPVTNLSDGIMPLPLRGLPLGMRLLSDKDC